MDALEGAEAWLEAVVSRHAATFTRAEYLKAIRALSARYVEGRARLASRSPLDTAGKRAAFAGFYAPLHYLTTRAILRALSPAARPSRIVDLGCGTGVAAAAWADTLPRPPAVVGVDQNTWALEEMRWNSRALGLRCRTRRMSMLPWLDAELALPRAPFRDTGIVCGWSLNELPAVALDRALTMLLAAHARSASVLVVEPLALSAVPWWNRWEARIVEVGGRTDEWRFPPGLPGALADLDDAAGFKRDHLTARSFWLPSNEPSRRT